MEQKTRHLILAGIVLGIGALSAFVCQSEGDKQEPTASAEPAAVQKAAEPPAPASAIRGRVEEAIDVKNYTYLRLSQDAAEDVWAAVPSTDVEKGSQVAVANPQLMTKFRSTSLERTFETIYFGQLAGPGVSGTPHGRMPAGHPGPGSKASSSGPGSPPSKAIEVGTVKKATGPSARTIAELFSERQALDTTNVRVRGVVVKAVPNVMNRTFLHLQDGTGDANAGTHDVAVTTSAPTPALGQTVTIEGTVAVERDFGAGYRYPVLVEDAQVVIE